MAGSSASSGLVNELWIAPDARAAIAASLHAAFLGDTPAIERDWERMAHAGRAALREHVGEALRGCPAYGRRAAPPPIVVVRGGADVTAIPPTPRSGFTDDALLAGVDAFLLGLCALLGIAPVSYPFENEGHLVRNVVPHPEFAEEESSWGYRTGLRWHQDNNFQPFEFDLDAARSALPMPRVLAFVALRNHELVPTQLLAVESVLERLSRDVRAQLQRPAFLVAPPPDVHLAPAGDGYLAPSAVVRVWDGIVFARLDETPGVRGVDRDAEGALQAVRNAIHAAAGDVVEVALRPGDAMVFDNYRVLHRRPPFEPCSTEAGRWLRRIYGRTAGWSGGALVEHPRKETGE